MTSSGRSGAIKYQNAGKSLSIGWEMAGTAKYDICIAPVDLRTWAVPKGLEIPIEKQLEILDLLREFLSKKNIRSDIQLPNQKLSNDVCMIAGCSSLALEGTAYCPAHFSRNMLIS